VNGQVREVVREAEGVQVEDPNLFVIRVTPGVSG
jgi:hypothetical protein